MIKVLDCTLRDGAYIVDNNFGEARYKGIIQKLCDANIDIIEIGFLRNAPHINGFSTFHDTAEIARYLPKNTATSFVAMIDYGRYDINNLSNFQEGSVDGIRDCFFKKDLTSAIDLARQIMKKGYDVYIQPIDILSYSDAELLDLITLVNQIAPHAFSIVDTFGSMYIEDLVRLFDIIHHNLAKDIKLGFHSHNNLQLSFALAQKFAEISSQKREIIIDSTVCGMGRGAGNTNTELLVDFLNKKFQKPYILNELLDLIDVYLGDIINKYQWGYSIPYFIAGIHGSHVNNINYLLDKHNLTSKDLRQIIESIDDEKIKRYDYANLDDLHKKYFTSNVDDTQNLTHLMNRFKKKNILLLAPGKSIQTHRELIKSYIKEYAPIVISINFIADEELDYVFYSNAKKYKIDSPFFKNNDIIKTSNIPCNDDFGAICLNYENLVKSGWKFADNSVIMMLRLLKKIETKKISLAGFDGFTSSNNYHSDFKAIHNADNDRFEELNENIREMLVDFNQTSSIDVEFITPSIFSNLFQR